MLSTGPRRRSHLMNRFLDCMKKKIPVQNTLYLNNIQNSITLTSLYFKNHFNHVDNFMRINAKYNYFKTQNSLYLNRTFSNIFCYSTLLANYINCITANPKTLCMAGFVSVLASLQGRFFFSQNEGQKYLLLEKQL